MCNLVIVVGEIMLNVHEVVIFGVIVRVKECMAEIIKKKTVLTYCVR